MVAVSAPIPPTTTTAGNGPVPLGSCTPAEKLELRPLFVTFTVMVVLVTVPVTLAGLGGLAPYTNVSASRLISSRLQRQSDTDAMRLPSSRRNGSGSRVSAVVEPGTVTAQSAPSSSTGEVNASGPGA